MFVFKVKWLMTVLLSICTSLIMFDKALDRSNILFHTIEQFLLQRKGAFFAANIFCWTLLDLGLDPRNIWFCCIHNINDIKLILAICKSWFPYINLDLPIIKCFFFLLFVFRTLTKNIRSRRGKRPAINVPGNIFTYSTPWLEATITWESSFRVFVNLTI